MPPGTAPRCPHCAAPISDARAERCNFCGNAFVPAVQPVEAAPRAPTVAELLASVEGHPELQKWLAWTPPERAVRFKLGLAMSVGILVAVVALVVLAADPPDEPAGVGFALVIAAIGLAMAVPAGLRAASFSRAPLQRVAVLVADERTKISGGGNDSSASTTYYATLEQADGSREEFEIDARLAGSIAPGDFGVAYVKGGLLLDFRRAGSR
jgi:hypothetical protein